MRVDNYKLLVWMFVIKLIGCWAFEGPELQRQINQLKKQVQRTERMNRKFRKSISPGLIVMFAGDESDIPDGWQLCDGRSGRPDLRDKFVVGAGYGTSSYNIGDTGGNDAVTLSTSNIPSHSHSITSAGSHKHYSAFQNDCFVSGIF